MPILPTGQWEIHIIPDFAGLMEELERRKEFSLNAPESLHAYSEKMIGRPAPRAVKSKEKQKAQAYD